MNSEIFLSHHNIISSLGFDSRAVVDNVENGISGLKPVVDKSILPESFFSSLIDKKKVEDKFSVFAEPSQYTQLEKLMIISLKEVIDASKLEINSRVGLIISTTKGNIDVLQENSAFPKKRAYLSEMGKQISQFFNFENEAVILSNACVSGILAVSVAKKFIQQDLFDHVFIVSGDLVSKFIMSGFYSFQALSSEMCQPYSINRSGINIGEAVASVLVTKDETILTKEAVAIVGEASSNDANHISGPSRTGEGLYRSIKSAMKEAGVSASDIDYISAHGTATNYNDEMEAIALNRIGLQNTALNSLKGYFGHTLGASGLVETIVGMHSLHRNTLYKSLGFDTLGVSVPVQVIEETRKVKTLNCFLKMASGFGGCNAAVVFQKK